MALSAYRLRRSAAILPRLLHRQLTAVSVPSYSPLPQAKSSASTTPIGHQASRSHRMIQFASFRSSAPLADRRSDSGENKISPDEILFEGCDFNHWLITMDFPKDPKPTPEQMVETYVETLAKVVGSREEAMKRMYACSTTTYTGFQAVMTEEMSEKFRGLPGVVFILPDSYIDPVNKEYGGDKYEMGKITHRPPPVQYGRQGRYGDRNRNYDRPRYDRSRDSSPMQGNQPYSRPGPMQGDGRNFAPQQNYNPMGQQNNPSYDRQGSMQGPGTNYTPQQTYTPVGQQGGPPYSHQGSMNNDSRNYAPNQSYGALNQSYGAAGGRDNYRPENRDTTPPYRGDFNQGGHGEFTSQGQSGFSQGQERYGGNTGSFGRDQYNQGTNYPGPAGQSFNPEAQTNFNSPGNPANGQGRH